MPGSLPEFIRALFWDVDPDSVDLDRHQNYVLGRVMSRGGWAAMRWLRETYEAAAIADYLVDRGDQLPPRERAYWSLITSTKVDDESGGGRPRWTAP